MRKNKWLYALSCIALVPTLTLAASIDLGAAANYAVLGINCVMAPDDLDVSLNSGSVVGNVGVSQPGSMAIFQKGSIDGDLHVRTDVGTLQISDKDFTITGAILQNATIDAQLAQASVDAFAASAFYDAFTPAASLNMNRQNHDLTGNGGYNVYDVNLIDYKDNTLTLNGTASDVFVFNVPDGQKFNWAQSTVALNGGVVWQNVLFNLLGFDPDGVINKADTYFEGTVLAPERRVDLHNPSFANGRILADEVRIHSDATLIPEPASLTLMMMVCAGGIFIRRRW